MLAIDGEVVIGAGSELFVGGAYAQGSSGVFRFELGDRGRSAPMAVVGTATLSGVLAMELPAGFEPTAGDSCVAMTYAAHSGESRVVLCDVAARRVAEILDAALPAGRHAFKWSGLSDFGGSAPSGFYFAVAEVRAAGVCTERRARVLFLR